MSVGPFVVGGTGFFSAGTRVVHVPYWILVMQMLGASELVRVPLRGFLQVSIPCSTAALTGAAVWIGAGGELRASDGIVSKALSFVGRVIRCPQNDPSGTKEP